jgi:hypothetical protein
LLLAEAVFADPQAILETFSRPSGETFYALSLDPPADLAGDVPQDIVVLFATSAGQTAMFREMGLAALQEFLASLNDASRVKLLAVDLAAHELSEGFVPPGSKEMQAAMEQLQMRAPLGSTDMKAVLTATADAFAQDTGRPRSAVSFGGGSSAINLLAPEELAQLVADLRDRQIDVSSYVLGVRTDGQLLAAIANQTGGNLYVAEMPAMADQAQGITLERANQENVAQGRRAGAVLADSAEAEVLWPTERELSPSLAGHLPRAFPPLRGDRASVLIGNAYAPLDQPVKVSVAAAEGNPQVSWKDPPHPTSAPNA